MDGNSCFQAVALSLMVKTRPQSRWKYLSYETKGDGRKGWKVQYDGIQHISLAKLSEAKTCLHDILVKKGEIDAIDSLPLRARFRKKATKPSKTQGVYLDKSKGVYRGVAISVGYHAKEADAAAAVKAAFRKRPAANCFGSVDLSMQGEARCDKSSISGAELRQRLPCLVTWGEPPLKKVERTQFPGRRRFF